MNIKRAIFISVILASAYGCAGIRDYGESVFSNLQLVSNKIVSIMLFEEENEAFTKQLEAHEEQINIECSALQQIAYRRMMREPVSSELEYEAGTILQECNEVVIRTNQFLKENGL